MSDTYKELPEVPQFCPTLTRRKLEEENALLVDVREPDEVAAFAFDVPGQMQIPLSALPQRLHELPRDRLLILACAGGQRSLKAAYFLSYHGFSQVANLDGGLEKWARKGFPVRGQATASCCAGGECCAPSTQDASAAASGGCCTPSVAIPAGAGGCCIPAAEPPAASQSCC